MKKKVVSKEELAEVVTKGSKKFRELFFVIVGLVLVAELIFSGIFDENGMVRVLKFALWFKVIFFFSYIMGILLMYSISTYLFKEVVLDTSEHVIIGAMVVMYSTVASAGFSGWVLLNMTEALGLLIYGLIILLINYYIAFKVLKPPIVVKEV